MKRIETLRDTPPGLAAYLEVEADDASWDRFRSHEAGAAYQELRGTLIDLQHGLCGYCEARLVEPHVQVEHVVPQRDPDDGHRRELDETNMMASCLGGTKYVGDREQFLPPVRENTSCGQAKGGDVDARFVDPRTVPAMPALVTVRDSGEIEADPDACAATGVPAEHVAHTIGLLGLDVRRLRQARRRRWSDLGRLFEDGLDDPDLIAEAARQELTPGQGGNLPAFFTTARSFFGPVAEVVLGDHPQAWI